MQPLPISACDGARICPISSGACPGACVFAEVMRSANLGIVVFDLVNSALLFANDEARALLEAGDTALDFASARSAFSNTDACGECSPPVAESRRIGTRLIGFTRYRNGAIEWVFCRDISEKVRLEAVAEAIDLSNSFSHVFAAVCHELGNPVNSAKMALSVLRRNFEVVEKEVALEFIDSTLLELERVSDLLASLRSYSFYEDVRPQAIEVDAFLSEFVGFTRKEFKQRGISLAFGAGSCGAKVIGDPRALRQVLMGLCANAAEAMVGRADASIVLETFGRNNEVVLTVCDNGPGVPSAELKRLFMPFFTTKPEGTGLGLVIARKMLARMSATIEIESEAGRGVCVLVTLSRAPS